MALVDVATKCYLSFILWNDFAKKITADSVWHKTTSCQIPESTDSHSHASEKM